MKKHIVAAIVSSLVLLGVAWLGLMLLPRLFPSLAEEYFNPGFRSGSGEAIFYFVHPVLLSFVLAWFWNRFKEQFSGASLIRGAELGLVYGLIAILPAMLINFSVLNVSVMLVICWLVYGVVQGIVAGTIFARLDP